MVKVQRLIRCLKKLNLVLEYVSSVGNFCFPTHIFGCYSTHSSLPRLHLFSFLPQKWFTWEKGTLSPDTNAMTALLELSFSTKSVLSQWKVM